MTLEMACLRRCVCRGYQTGVFVGALVEQANRNLLEEFGVFSFFVNWLDNEWYYKNIGLVQVRAPADTESKPLAHRVGAQPGV